MVYTQSPPLTGEEAESLLREAQVARFCSLNADGTIHAAPVWFRYENGLIRIGTPEASRKARNAERNRNVTVLVDVEGPPSRGLIVYGQAELEHNVTVPMATSVLEKYMPKEKAERLARGLLEMTRWVRISVKPERIVSFDYAKDDTYRAAYRASQAG
ncbi:MAG: pyridoxamine 5'-phosphate oxidase family protein [Candidatus Bathyarchaeia archaeon]